MNYLETMGPYADIDVSELQDQTEVDTQPTDEEIVGNEDFAYYPESAMSSNKSMNMTAILPKLRSAFMIRTTDNTNFRIYMRSDAILLPKEVNKLCRFIDTRKPNESITFILGVSLCDEQSQLMGPLLSSIIECKAKVKTIAAGMCSLCETMIWVFGHEREIYKYGALIFAKPEFLKACGEYKHYYDVVYSKAKEIGVITDEQIAKIYSTNEDLMLMYSDLVK